VYLRVDSFNENGITEGKTVERDPGEEEEGK
jgi:hypothetical protein